jgi:hypothetical protein
MSEVVPLQQSCILGVGGHGDVNGTKCGGKRDRLTASEVFLALHQIIWGTNNWLRVRAVW